MSEENVRKSKDTFTKFSGTGVKHDQGKPDLSLVPAELLEQAAYAFMDGEKKYGRYNFTGGIKMSRLLAASLRHIVAFMWGEDKASDSGVNHLGHAAACIAMALWMQKNKPETDDRFKNANS